MIRVVCRTNIDRYQLFTWPRYMAGVPHKGDHVECLEGHRLTVIGVRHPYMAQESTASVEIELHYDQNQMELDKLRGWWP